MVRLIAAACIAALSVFSQPGTADAADLKSVRVIEQASLPKAQPSWPVPNDLDQIFYLQRSTNRNTVVYAANFDGNGNLSSKTPAVVYWRRYADGGERKALKGVERRFAYGLNSRKRKTAGEYTIWLKPAPELPMLLRQTAPGKADLWANIGGRTVRAVYAYLEVDESGLLPKVTALTIYGIDPSTGRGVAEVFSVSGGSFQE